MKDSEGAIKGVLDDRFSTLLDNSVERDCIFAKLCFVVLKEIHAQSDTAKIITRIEKTQINRLDFFSLVTSLVG